MLLSLLFWNPFIKRCVSYMCINTVSIIEHNTWNTTIDIIGLKKKMNSREICPKKTPRRKCHLFIEHVWSKLAWHLTAAGDIEMFIIKLDIGFVQALLTKVVIFSGDYRFYTRISRSRLHIKVTLSRAWHQWTFISVLSR